MAVGRDQYRKLFKAMEEAGYQVHQQKSGHYGIYNQAGKKIYTLPFSPSCERAWKNDLAGLKRVLGFDFRATQKGKR